MIVKMLWPEEYEFTMEDIETRGTGATLAEAIAIHYWGEDCGTQECQSIVTMLIGQFINYATLFVNIPLSVEYIPNLLLSFNELTGLTFLNTPI